MKKGYTWECKKHKTFGDPGFVCTYCRYPKTDTKKKCTWKKLKPIGKYWLEVETDTPYRIVLHRKDSGTWSDSVRAMSHLMKEIVQ